MCGWAAFNLFISLKLLTSFCCYDTLVLNLITKGASNMSIYYYRLWDLLEQKGLTQSRLAKELDISTATFARMRRDQFVSLETVERIREYLGCDFSDIITSIPPNTWRSKEQVTSFPAEKYLAAYRAALKVYMAENALTPAAISTQTTLSPNTVKGFLSGKPLSARSLVKLMGLGQAFQEAAMPFLSAFVHENAVYCESCNHGKPCLGFSHKFLPETKSYDHYCRFGFTICRDDGGNFVSFVDCPHPKSMRQFDTAVQKYGDHFRSKVIVIPPKGEGER